MNVLHERPLYGGRSLTLSDGKIHVGAYGTG